MENIIQVYESTALKPESFNLFVTLQKNMFKVNLQFQGQAPFDLDLNDPRSPDQAVYTLTEQLPLYQPT